MTVGYPGRISYILCFIENQWLCLPLSSLDSVLACAFLNREVTHTELWGNCPFNNIYPALMTVLADICTGLKGSFGRNVLQKWKLSTKRLSANPCCLLMGNHYIPCLFKDICAKKLKSSCVALRIKVGPWQSLFPDSQQPLSFNTNEINLWHRHSVQAQSSWPCQREEREHALWKCQIVCAFLITSF